MAKPEWGTKRDCPHCGTRFYDLGKDKPHCPKCSAEYTASAKVSHAAASAPKAVPVPKPEPKPKPAVVAEEGEEAAEELIAEEEDEELIDEELIEEGEAETFDPGEVEK